MEKHAENDRIDLLFKPPCELNYTKCPKGSYIHTRRPSVQFDLTTYNYQQLGAVIGDLRCEASTSAD